MSLLALGLALALQVVEATPVPACTTPEEQLVQARAAQAAITGSRGELKRKRQQAAVEAWRAVREHHPRARAAIAEAAFRRGELLRAMEESGASRGAFQEVLEFAPADSTWRVRALLELGHLARREGEWEKALVSYRRARETRGADLRHRNAAREWITKVQLKRGAWTAAEAAARDWRQHAASLLEEVRAEDRRLEALIGQRRLTQAWRELEELRERMAEHARRPTDEAEAIATALEGMRAPTLLRRARRNGR
jgi:tetratricopeptide (TPR) repeat protein